MREKEEGKTRERNQAGESSQSEKNIDADGNIIDPNTGYSAPMTCYNNILYLPSIHGNQMCSRADKNNVSPSILYRSYTFMKTGLPIILNKEELGEEVEVNYNALNATSIKIRLVDFHFQGVMLKSLSFICLEIQPVEPKTMVQVYWASDDVVVFFDALRILFLYFEFCRCL